MKLKHKLCRIKSTTLHITQKKDGFFLPLLAYLYGVWTFELRTHAFTSCIRFLQSGDVCICRAGLFTVDSPYKHQTQGHKTGGMSELKSFNELGTLLFRACIRSKKKCCFCIFHRGNVVSWIHVWMITYIILFYR